MAIIPQDPVLFLGTVKSNLDPFRRYSEQELWDALDTCQMKAVVQGRPNQLESTVAEGGSNFSMGERQLLCIARAVLRKPKLLLLDEATASIDLNTDKIIQRMLRTVFKDCTTLIIAHRLNTILDCSHIAVLDEGKLLQFGSPKDLLAQGKGAFHEMVEAAGMETAAEANDGAIQLTV
jgi:ABC-type multidrug transport system fused ATPase/permease subunit